MNRKIVIGFVIFVILGAILLFFFYKPRDPECEAIAKEATKEQFFQKGPYEAAYQNCLKQK